MRRDYLSGSLFRDNFLWAQETISGARDQTKNKHLKEVILNHYVLASAI